METREQFVVMLVPLFNESEFRMRSKVREGHCIYKESGRFLEDSKDRNNCDRCQAFLLGEDIQKLSEVRLYCIIWQHNA